MRITIICVAPKKIPLQEVLYIITINVLDYYLP
jgi:hypothetical protein